MMQQNGLGKLAEEAGEMLQIAGKLVQYPELQTIRNVAHPDGTLLHERLEEEMGDTVAAINFVIAKMNLDTAVINARASRKLRQFKEWDEPVDKKVKAPDPEPDSNPMHRWGLGRGDKE